MYMYVAVVVVAMGWWYIVGEINVLVLFKD